MNSLGDQVTEEQWSELSQTAWNCREKAFVIGNTKVGAAVLTGEGNIFGGCNVEHRFRCHDVHAEVNAITSMIAAGGRSISAILVAAERNRFTPCGGCMDWIMQFGSESTIIAFQAKPDGTIEQYTAKQLMPFYPS